MENLHVRLGARMVPFAGWNMPLQYTSIMDEHAAVRGTAGIFDISHMGQFLVSGPGALAWLNKMLANNVAKLATGQGQYSFLLNETGGVIDDLIAYYLGGGRYRVVVNAATSEKDIRWMRACIESWRMQLTLTPRCELAMLAVQGPHAREAVWQALPGIREATVAMPPFHAQQLEDFFVARTGYTGEDGFELTFPATLADALWNRLLELGVKPCGLGARDTLRLEAGMNLYGQDMDEETSPLDTGLAWTVVFDTARNFVGREALLTRSRQSQFLVDRRRYAGSLAALGIALPASLTSKYTIAVAAADGPPPAYTITATAIGHQAQDKCPTLALDNAGNRTPAGCW